MPSVAWDEFLPKVLPFVPGVPDEVAEDAIRIKAIELCRRARVWRVELDAIDIVANVYLYDLNPGDGMVVTDVVGAELSRLPFPMKTPDMLTDAWPGWKTATAQSPSCFYLENDRQIRVVAIPLLAAVGAITIRAAIKPAVDSDGIEQMIFEEYQETIGHGAVAHLLSIPNKAWTDGVESEKRERRYLNGITSARTRARKSFMSGSSLAARPREFGY